MAVDLLRPALRPARPKVTTARLVATVDLAVSGIVLALALAIGVQWFLVQRTLDGYDAEAAALQPRWSAVRSDVQQIQRLRRDVNALQTAFTAPEWIDVFEAVRAAMPPGLWLFKVSVIDTGALEVTVRTTQPPAAAQFIQRLQATPGLRDVRLVLTETVRAAGADVSQATIAAQVAPR
ncbi:MAG TPA: PilN domain-containing protein [bacterium]